MLRIAKFLAPCLLWASTLVGATPVSLPGGLTVDLPEQLDLTYQIIPDYDENEKVIAGWSNDKLQYFVALSRLPAGYLDGPSYLAALARDLRKAWGSVEVGQQATYRTESGMSGTTVVLFKPASGKSTSKTILIAHHLTDGKASFVATATVMPTASIDTASEHVKRILSSASTARTN